jgi:hypothetical protein
LTCSSLNLNSAHFGWTNLDWGIRCGETWLLVSWCVGGECNMADNEEDRGRSRRLNAEDRGWSGTSRVLGDQTIGRSGDAVCYPHCTHGGDMKHGFSGLATKPVVMVCQWFYLKTTTTVSWFRPQNQGRQFGDLVFKIIATVSCFVPQNQVGWGLSVCISKPMSGWTWCEDTRWHPTGCFIVKQVGLWFLSFVSKLAKERQRVVHVAL